MFWAGYVFAYCIIELELPAEICASGKKTVSKIPQLNLPVERDRALPQGQSFRFKPQYRGKVHADDDPPTSRWLTVKRDGKRRARSAEDLKKDPYGEVGREWIHLC